MTGALLWQAKDAAAAVNGTTSGDWAAAGVVIDSRAVQPGDLFVAIDGDRLDGHAYVQAAFSNGAAAALVHKVPDGVDARDPRLLNVSDTTKALAALGAAARLRTDAKILAVTGSVGKTGTKEMLRLALSALGQTHASAGNLNNHWGAPLSLARMPSATDFGVLELGMNHAGEIGPLSTMTAPHGAIITRIAPAHTEFFDSIEAVADAKAEIFEGVQPGGFAVLNADDPMFGRLARQARQAGIERVIRFGERLGSDVLLTKLKLSETGSRVDADILGKPLRWTLQAPGAHWAANSLAVIAAVHGLGGDVAVAAKALAEMKAPAGRGERRKIALSDGQIDLIDESYNASPVAVRAAFAALALAKPKRRGRRIAILGDMLELGAESPLHHAQLADAFVAAKLDVAHAAGPECKLFIEALPPKFRGKWAENSEALAAEVDDLARAGDVVLVKGSLGMGMRRIVDALEALGSPASGAAHAV
jgi:UDP-N-acetylmuramoyl-tripeptide--D-alanyl-D-alanine ligase